jgi:hypothetical protein
MPPNTAAIEANAITREGEVPDADIDRAVRRKRAFVSNPAVHPYAEHEKP